MRIMLLASAACLASAAAAAPPKAPLKRLSRMYLMTHGLAWLDITPDDPRRQTALWEQWPGRSEICYRYEHVLKERYYRLLESPPEDTGILCLPDGLRGNTEFIEAARKAFGKRCVVCRLGNSPAADRKALGEAFERGLDADRRRAGKVRGPNLTEGEIGAWERSKCWATDLRLQLEAQGYTFDPKTVEFSTFGEDWCGCAATYPIHMGRALGLARPIARRFELINPDCSPLLLGSTAIEQNLPMPKHIRLFLFRTAEGRLLAQYWEGMHALWERPRQVTVTFPPGTARLVDTHGSQRGEALYGRVMMGAGCGGHTPWHSDLVQAEPGLSFADFRRALLAGRVTSRAE